MAVLLMRHGPTALNSSDLGKDRIRGWSDVPLSHEGRHVARQLADRARRYRMHDLTSSDLSRAADTAHDVAKTTHLPVHLTKNLRPWDLGQLTGRSTKAVLPFIKTLVEHPDLKAPGGESFASFMQRYIPTIAPLLSDDKLHGVVTHIRNIKAIEALIAGQGHLHQDTWNAVPAIEPGGMVYADDQHFVPLSKEGDQHTGAGS
jgi:broad specificity phosphatase PhoE